MVNPQAVASLRDAMFEFVEEVERREGPLTNRQILTRLPDMWKWLKQRGVLLPGMHFEGFRQQAIGAYRKNQAEETFEKLHEWVKGL